MKKQKFCPGCGSRMTEIYWKRRQANRTARGKFPGSIRKKRAHGSLSGLQDRGRRFQFWICKRCRLKKRK